MRRARSGPPRASSVPVLGRSSLRVFDGGAIGEERGGAGRSEEGEQCGVGRSGAEWGGCGAEWGGCGAVWGGASVRWHSPPNERSGVKWCEVDQCEVGRTMKGVKEWEKE